MVSYQERLVNGVLKLQIFPYHWKNFFYEYFNLREVGRSRKEAKEQAMKMTVWRFKKSYDL